MSGASSRLPHAASDPPPRRSRLLRGQETSRELAQPSAMEEPRPQAAVQQARWEPQADFLTPSLSHTPPPLLTADQSPLDAASKPSAIPPEQRSSQSGPQSLYGGVVPKASASAPELPSRDSVIPRKRSPDPDELHSPNPPACNSKASAAKRQRLSAAERLDRIAFWSQHSQWPSLEAKASDISINMPSDIASAKRTRTSSDPAWKSSQNSSLGSRASPSDRKPLKHYRDPRWDTIMTTKGVISANIASTVEQLPALQLEFCERLFERKWVEPKRTLFDDNIYSRVLALLAGRNETRTVRDIGLLVAPSPDIMNFLGETRLDYLSEDTNASWTRCMAFEGPRPQPDFCVGLRADSIHCDSLHRAGLLQAVPSELGALPHLIFPFLAVEAKSKQGSLMVALRQNVHSMAVASRAILRLAQRAGTEHAAALTEKPLGFSIAYNNTNVNISVHWFTFSGIEPRYHNQCLRAFDLNFQRQRWESYHFVRTLYDTFAPLHRDRILGLIDKLPPPARSFLAEFRAGQEDND